MIPIMIAVLASLRIVAASTVLLAQTKCVLGEVDRAQTMNDKAIAISVEAPHAPTADTVLQLKALFELLRNDAEP